MHNNQIIIIGSGPASLMAAQQLALKGFNVQVFEQNKAAARKFLVAGNGGFNLTHNEDILTFVEKYDSSEIKKIVKAYDNKKVINWLKEIGISTYIGSSGKIFPTKEFKPIQVLKAWLDYLEKLNVKIHYEHKMVDFDKENVVIENQGKIINIKFGKLILGLGGGSWQKTGSDAKWIDLFKSKNIKIKDLEPANSGYETKEIFRQLEGQYLKNINVKCQNISKRGEVVFTNYGIEGSPIYFTNRFVRKQLFPQTLLFDLKPNLTEETILKELEKPERITKILKSKLKLSITAINLLKTLDKTNFSSPEILANHIKNFPLEISGFRPIDEVISTAGGLSFDELNDNLELKKFPNIFCIGEMLDWEAPTGGYLLQACFSTGFWVGEKIEK